MGCLRIIFHNFLLAFYHGFNHGYSHVFAVSTYEHPSGRGDNFFECGLGSKRFLMFDIECKMVILFFGLVNLFLAEIHPK